MTGIAEIENAMLQRVRLASQGERLGYHYRTLESYPEDFDDYLKEVVVNDRAFPAAWVVFGGWRPPVDEGSALQAPAVFMMVVAAQSLRNEKATRHGVTPTSGKIEVGAYQLMLDAAALLHGEHLGLDIGPLQLGACRSVRPTQTIRERKLSVFALEFSTRLPIDVTRFPARALDDFSTFSADWDVPPFGELTQIPAENGVADATDRLELPQ